MWKRRRRRPTETSAANRSSPANVPLDTQTAHVTVINQVSRKRWTCTVRACCTPVEMRSRCA
eukprot:1183813-Prorocentrum_minimum.AAC.2